MNAIDEIKLREEAPQLALSPEELARSLGISRAHLFRLHSAGKLPKPVRFGRSVRWPVREIERWLSAGGPCREKWEELLKDGRL
jgi:excisionase family DNA binding protein